MAQKRPGQTGEELVKILETRIDNLVYRMGLATSIRQARQMVVHGHVRLNGIKVDIPSHPVHPGDTLALSEKSKSTTLFTDNFKQNALTQYPYISKDVEGFAATLIRLPERQEIPIEINDHLIVEYYSR